jgi:hypothetical protein
VPSISQPEASPPPGIARSSPSSIQSRITLLFKRFRVIDVMTAMIAGNGESQMTFTIDNENNITAHGTPEEAAATTATPFDSFASQKELAKLAAAWPTERLVEIWNGFAGVVPFDQLKPVKKFTDRKSAVVRIWQAIQVLGEDLLRASIRDAEAGLKVAQAAQVAPQVPPVAPEATKARRRTTPATKAPKAKKAAKAESAGPREGSKKAQVIAMLQRKNGATLAEIADKMGWKSWTVRGFMAGAMKKAGYKIESFKSDKGERTYRINS